MDRRFLGYYERELKFLREMGAQFAAENTAVASKLGLTEFDCLDPYVERLLEGFAFLAARVHLELDGQFPKFTRHLLELTYPNFLRPIPSMAIVRFDPDRGKRESLAAGYSIPRGAALRSALPPGEQTACEFRTAHDVTVWPIEVAEAEYLTALRDVAEAGTAALKDARAAIRIRLRGLSGASFDAMPLDALTFFLPGVGEQPARLHEQILANATGVVVRPGRRPAPWTEILPRSAVRRVGFDDAEAILPYAGLEFQGHRLLQEYFALPQRFLFFALSGLGSAVRRCKDTELELTILLDRSDPILHNVVNSRSFALFCTPAVNLFPRAADNIVLEDRTGEYQLLADRARPIDFEVFAVTRVSGSGGAGGDFEFRPFYSRREAEIRGRRPAYYATRREPRRRSDRERARGKRGVAYAGTEIYLSIVDTEAAPHAPDLRQLAVQTLCTNRDLPSQMSVGAGATDFTLTSGAPIGSVRCVAGPSPPRPPFAEGDTTWRLIGQLSLNYVALGDADGQQAAANLREMVALHAAGAGEAMQRHATGFQALRTHGISRRIHDGGMSSLVRGVEIDVTFEDGAFAGSGPFVLGAVLAEFFRRYVSINSFTETVVRTVDRGELTRWSTRRGRRPVF